MERERLKEMAVTFDESIKPSGIIFNTSTDHLKQFITGLFNQATNRPDKISSLETVKFRLSIFQEPGLSNQERETRLLFYKEIFGRAIVENPKLTGLYPDIPIDLNKLGRYLNSSNMSLSATDSPITTNIKYLFSLINQNKQPLITIANKVLSDPIAYGLGLTAYLIFRPDSADFDNRLSNIAVSFQKKIAEQMQNNSGIPDMIPYSMTVEDWLNSREREQIRNNDNINSNPKSILYTKDNFTKVFQAFNSHTQIPSVYENSLYQYDNNKYTFSSSKTIGFGNINSNYYIFIVDIGGIVSVALNCDTSKNETSTIYALSSNPYNDNIDLKIVKYIIDDFSEIQIPKYDEQFIEKSLTANIRL